MPFTGFLKLGDIPGESQSIEENADLLDPASYKLLTIVDETIGDEGSWTFDFFSLPPPDEHANNRAKEEFTINFSKIEISYIPVDNSSAEGLNELVEALQASFDAEGLDVDIWIRTQGGGGDDAKIYDITFKFSDPTISSYETSGKGGEDTVIAADGLLTASLTDAVEPDPPPGTPFIDDFLI